MCFEEFAYLERCFRNKRSALEEKQLFFNVRDCREKKLKKTYFEPNIWRRQWDPWLKNY